MENLDGYRSEKKPTTTLDANEIPAVLSLVLYMAGENIVKGIKKPKASDTSSTESWQTIASHLLYHAYTAGLSNFVAAEMAAAQALVKWPSNRIDEWISKLPTMLDSKPTTRNTIPYWFGCCVLMVLFEASRDVLSKRWNMSDAILGELYSNNPFDSFHSQNEALNSDGFINSVLHFCFKDVSDSKNLLDSLDKRMDQIQYGGHGVFNDGDGHEIVKRLSMCGQSIWHSIFLGQREVDEGIDHTTAFDRARRLSKILRSACEKTNHDQATACSVLWITFVAIAFLDVPPFRDFFVKEIRSYGGKDEDERNVFLELDFSALALIVSLTKSAVAYEERHVFEPFNDLFEDRNMMPSSLGHLGLLFLDEPSIRPKILEFATRMLAPLNFYPHLYKNHSDCQESTEKLDPNTGNRFDNIEVEHRYDHFSMTKRVHYGLHCLLGLLRRDDWGDVEIKAWMVFSDVLVQNLPCLHHEGREDLYLSVEDFVTDETCGEIHKQRVLRALVMRLASFFHVHEVVIEDIDIKELVTIHRLVVLILQSLASIGDNSTGRLQLLAQGRDAFLRAVLDSQVGQFSSQRPVEMFVRKSILEVDEFKSESFALSWGLFLAINVTMGDMMTSTKANKGRSPRSRGNRSSLEGLDIASMTSLIRSLEMRSLIDHSAATSNDPSLPDWVLSTTKSPEKDSVTLSWCKGKSFQNASICLLLELLFSIPLPLSSSMASPDAFSWKMVEATEKLLKQEWRDDDHDSDSEGSVLLEYRTIERTGEAVVALFSAMSREVIRRDCDLYLAEKLFSSIVTYCNSLNSHGDDFAFFSDLLISFWDLYNGLASERSAVKVILYLENHIGEEVQSRSTFSFLNPLTSSKDVNRAIRNLRVSCLKALGNVIPAGLSLEDTNNVRVPKDVVEGMLEALVEDLRRGLSGDSGGISSQLYMSYCTVIEKCANNVFEGAKTNSDPSVVILFRKVSLILSEILIRFPLGTAERFKSTFVLGLVTLPTMSRSTLRETLSVTPTRMSPEILSLDPISDLIDTTYDDCLKMLSRWSTLRDPLSVPWEDIAGHQHTNSPNNSETSVVSLGSHDDRQNVTGPSVQRIRLTDKEVWSWALSCSIFCLKRTWQDSFDVIHTAKNEMPSICTKLSCRLFFKIRKSELRSTMSKILRFFLPATDSHDHVALDMLAMNMPSHPRDLLCASVACISQVLTDAAKRVSDCLNEKFPEKIIYSLSTLESLCCLSAWLSGDTGGEKASRIEDFAVGVFKWLEMASRKRLSGDQTSNSRRADAKDLKRDVSNIAEYIYQLYLSLKDLERSLRKRCTSKNTDFHNICKLMLSEGSKNQQNSIGDSATIGTCSNTSNLLLHYVSLKVRRLLQTLPREYRERTLPDFPAITKQTSTLGSKKRDRPSSSLFGRSTQSRSRLWSLSQRQLNKRARGTSLSRVSRNPALEAMWALDQEADREQEGGRPRQEATKRSVAFANRTAKKKRSMYAAADLEDFITPG